MMNNPDREQARLLAYYKRMHSGGKRLPIRVADTLFFFAVLMLCIYLAVSRIGYFAYISLTISALICTAIFVAWLLAYKTKLNSFISRTQAKMAHNDIAKKLCYMDEASFFAVAEALCKKHEIDRTQTYVSILQRGDNVSGNDVLCTYSAAKKAGFLQACIITNAELCERANELISGAVDMSFVVLSRDELAKQYITEQCIDVAQYANALVLTDHTSKKASFFGKLRLSFGKKASDRYVILGIILLVFSFIVPYSFYYRLIAVLCVTVGTYAKLFSAQR